ncbi:50S ribosome-binding protein YggL [Paraferrimonas sp. SM1919]|uniref:50S ribosome-binding protein YggL n=1 Tax=Paraferrimonas sp. SM1919 TaxID=2662263 RepID=UPI0013D6B378|nr:50S ribosome-binding protein YggL [Paraferrimonas sp. SM1919]
MARSRRLRKKLRVDEFQELAFDVSWLFNDEVTEEQIDAIVDEFIATIIEPNDLGFHAGGHKDWEGIVATQRIGQCTNDQRQQVEAFWQAKPVTNVVVSELYDLWWDSAQ